MALLALLVNLVNNRRFLHYNTRRPPGGAICISFKVGHQVVSLALPWHYQLVLSLYIHQPESHHLSLQKVKHSLSEFERHGPIDQTDERIKQIETDKNR